MAGAGLEDDRQRQLGTSKTAMGGGGWKDERDIDRRTRFWFAIMTRFRGVIMVALVLPLSFLMECFFEARDWCFRTFQVCLD